MKIPNHIVESFINQKEHNKPTSNDKAIEIIKQYWENGTIQTPKQYNSTHKFSRYGLEKAEYRRLNDWILTCVNETLVSVHYKTLQERRRDKKRRLKENQKKKGKR